MSQQSPALTALTAFPLFPTLPLELRLKIWKCAAAEPRHVYTRAQGQTRHATPSSENEAEVDFFLLPVIDLPSYPGEPSDFPSCSPLQSVCKEARLETQRWHMLHHEPKHGEPKLYFNFGADTMIYTDFLSPQRLLASLMPDTIPGKAVGKIRTFASGWQYWNTLFGSNDLMGVMRSLWLVGVEEVLIIVGDSSRFCKSFKPAEVDFEDEYHCWQLLRRGLKDPETKLTVADFTMAFRDKIREVRDICLKEMDRLVEVGETTEADFETNGEYLHLGGRVSWPVPQLRFVEGKW